MSVRDVTSYRKVHGVSVEHTRRLTERTRQATTKINQKIAAHYREVEEEVHAATEAAQADEEFARKQAALLHLEQRRGKKL